VALAREGCLQGSQMQAALAFGVDGALGAAVTGGWAAAPGAGASLAGKGPS